MASDHRLCTGITGGRSYASLRVMQILERLILLASSDDAADSIFF
jgi:hypothetical protein